MTLSNTARGLLGCLALGAAACSDDDFDLERDSGLGLDAGRMLDATLEAGVDTSMSFFVTSDKSMTGNLGGITGADARCQALATAVGAGNKTWRAFLSVERDPANADMPTSALQRIGQGPWFNANGALVASNVDALYGLNGNAELFLDERGTKINGQWEGSPTPNEHDILTGTYLDGGVAFGKTCGDWTSMDAGPNVAIVGHSDGLGPNRNPNPPYNSWFSSHESAGCNDTAPRGGAGRIYCFAAN